MSSTAVVREFWLYQRKLVFKSSSLVNQALHFWWNETTDSNEGFKLDWKIENGNLPDVMELVSKDHEGSISTPGLGSLPPPNYYKERHEYTAVIELPHNVTDAISTPIQKRKNGIN